MAEVSGDVSGAAVANGANSGGRQGLRRTAVGGEVVAESFTLTTIYHTE